MILGKYKNRPWTGSPLWLCAGNNQLNMAFHIAAGLFLNRNHRTRIKMATIFQLAPLAPEPCGVKG